MKKCLRGRERFRETDTKRDEPNGLKQQGILRTNKEIFLIKYTD